MPIYEYQCQSCGNEVEVIQKISDDPLKDCDECSNSDMKKKVSSAGFRLSGSGWYETDFKQGSKKNLASKNNSKQDSKNKTSSKKTATKSENKTTASKN